MIQNKLRPLSGRCVWVFGLPCSGKSTIIQAVIDSSREIIARISSGDIARRLSTDADIQHMVKGGLFPHEEVLRKEIMDTVYKRKASGSEVVFIDGYPRQTSQITHILNEQLAGTVAEGCFIRIHLGIDEIITRAKYRMRDDQDKFESLMKKIDTQQKLISEVDKSLLGYGFPYYTIPNDDLEFAVKQMIKFVGLKK